MRGLKMMQEKCRFIGPTEMTVKGVVERVRSGMERERERGGRKETEGCQRKESKMSEDVSVVSQSLSDKPSKGVINEASLFRGKKKRPVPKPTQHHPSSTPTKACKPRHKHTPSTQQSLLSTNNATPPTPLFKKIKKQHPQHRPNRTLYFGEAKHFQGKNILSL